MLLALLAAGAVNMAVNDPVDGAMLLSTAVLVTVPALRSALGFAWVPPPLVVVVSLAGLVSSVVLRPRSDR